MKHFLFVIALSVLAGCVQNLGQRDSSGNLKPLIPANVGKERIDRVKQIRPGMTMDEVKDFVGSPTDRETRGNQEAWLYCQIGITDAHGRLGVIFFRDGVATGSDSRVRVGDPKPCKFAFFPVRWNEVEQRR